MTVKEMISKLIEMPTDAEVQICYGWLDGDESEQYDYVSVSNIFTDKVFDDDVVFIENNIYEQ